MPSYIHDLPSYQSNLDLTGLPFLSEYDIDENVPNTFHSRYFTISELALLTPGIFNFLFYIGL